MRIPWILLAAVPAAAQIAAQDGRGPVPLSLKRAVELALSPEGSTSVQLSGEALKQAQERRLEVRAALLPDVESSVTYRDQTENLSALGITGIAVPIPGFHFPQFVGPFNTFDARLTGTQNIFDFSSIRKFQASKTGVSAARQDAETTGEQVAAQVARAYLLALKGDADVQTAQSNVTLSEAVLVQANNQKAAGTGTGIEITRARVQLANDRQHLLEAQNALRSRESAAVACHWTAAGYGAAAHRPYGVCAGGCGNTGASQSAGDPDAARLQGAAGARIVGAAFGERHETGALAHSGGVR